LPLPSTIARYAFLRALGGAINVVLANSIVDHVARVNTCPHYYYRLELGVFIPEQEQRYRQHLARSERAFS
jgi:hypothetical protein